MAVTAFLAARKSASRPPVTKALAALYEEDLRSEIPSLLPPVRRV
jgi:hypothetical protein